MAVADVVGLADVLRARQISFQRGGLGELQRLEGFESRVGCDGGQLFEEVRCCRPR